MEHTPPGSFRSMENPSHFKRALKPGFHMIATIAAITKIAEKKFSDRSDHMEATLQRSQRQQQYQDALRSRHQNTEIPSSGRSLEPKIYAFFDYPVVFYVEKHP